MRKSTLFFLMMLVLGASAQPISEQEALQKAQQFLHGKTIVSTEPAGALRRAANDNPYKHLYLFNTENNGGFVIVAGDSRAREILGYAEEGSLDVNQMPDNMKWWLSRYDQTIANLPAYKPAGQETSARRASKTDITPMMKYSWSQSSPFNAHSPNNYDVGCVALSVAQMMAFHGYPSTMPSLSGYTDANGNNLEALSSRSINYSNFTSDDAAWLARYAGQALRTTYSANGSSAKGELVQSVMVKTFGFDLTTHNVYRDAFSATEWDDLLYDELSHGRPFILTGQDVENYNSGHSFICHGYSQGYYAVNWGWGGTHNGYFAMSAMNGDGHTYGTDLVACIGIQPNAGGTITYTPFSLTECASTSGSQVYRSSSSSAFSFNMTWTVHNSLNQNTDYDFAVAIFKPDGTTDLLSQYSKTTFPPAGFGKNPISISIPSRYGNGTYKITIIFKEPGSNSWKVCVGINWRYIQAVINGNTLSLTNYPLYDEPYQTGTPTPYNPEGPDVTEPVSDLAFEYPTAQVEYKNDDVDLTIDWSALSSTMFATLGMNETSFFDNYWADCFTSEYPVTGTDARYVSPYAYNYNADGSYGVNIYDMLVFNLGTDIFGNNGQLPDPEEAEEVDPEYDYVAIAAFYPNVYGPGKHFLRFEIPDYIMENLLDGETSPVTFTRWIRFAAKTDNAGNTTAPYRYLWIKVSMEFSWSEVDGIWKVTAVKADGPVYNLRGQRVDDSYKGIVIKNGVKHIQK